MNNQFAQKYEMHVYPSHRRLRRIPRNLQRTNMWNVNISDSMLYQDSVIPIEEVECVDITMPRDRLEELEKLLDWFEDKERHIKHYEDVVQQLRADERVRIEYPAVQKAYMKYLTLLELARK